MSEPLEEYDDGAPEEQVPGTSFYGQSCVKCNLPIHYSYTSEISGYCGRCTDTVRKQILDGHRANLERDLIGAKLPEGGGGGAGRMLLGFLAGGVIGVAAALAVAAFQPDPWEKIVTALLDLVGRGK